MASYEMSREDGAALARAVLLVGFALAAAPIARRAPVAESVAP